MMAPHPDNLLHSQHCHRGGGDKQEELWDSSHVSCGNSEEMLITQCPLVRRLCFCVQIAAAQLIRAAKELRSHAVCAVTQDKTGGFCGGFFLFFFLLMHELKFLLFISFFQDFEKPSPPQKPLPADPLGRSSRLGHSATAAGGHLHGKAPLPIPIPTVPRPPPTIPLPSRCVQHDKTSACL